MTSIVRLMHYSAAWPQEFQQAKSGILQSCAGDVVQVEHIGSTAIPGLVARPVIDMVACVRKPELLEAAAARLEGLFFRRAQSPSWCEEAVMMHKPRHGELTHRLLLSTLDDRAVARTLAIRDFLRREPARAVDFEHAKIRRWKDQSGELEAYERDKAVFFAHLEEQLGLP